MSKIHYYELSFYHDEDDDIATEKRCGFCIKTEIPPVIDDKTALNIFMSGYSGQDKSELSENLTCIQEISEDEALSFFDIDDLNHRIENEYGVYYIR